jgi:hypothetical protein
MGQASGQKIRAKIAAEDVWKVVASGSHVKYVLDEIPVSNDAVYCMLAIIEGIDTSHLR